MSKNWVCCACLWLLGCGAAQAGAPASVEPANTAAQGATEQPKSDGAHAGKAPSAAAAGAEAAAPKRERIRLHNSCSKPVPLRIERDHDSDTDTSLSSNTSTEEHATDGDEIRLLDDHRNVLSALKIEPSTQEVNVTSDCSKLESR